MTSLRISVVKSFPKIRVKFKLFEQLDGTPENTRQNVRVMENISSKLTTYTILGLEPGESYKIELGTKTGTVSTRQSIADLILTRYHVHKPEYMGKGYEYL
jgi:hypothetical protein